MSKRTAGQVTQQGFTIVELMLTIVIMGILATVAVPSFREAAERAALRSAATDMIVAINTARAQAVASRESINLRSTDNADWGNGWTIDYPLAVQEKDQNFVPKNGITVVETGANQTAEFRSTGLLNTALTFQICNTNLVGEPGREISVTRAGRVTNTDFGGC